ncbi:GAF and ANTAR domain-containing protein [Rhodococcus cercidiphylli]|jgi:GAF domain-containing protein|uniref:GAF and ANTAR domain-containing protein n=1 Tax=Rhodococcus cercidiphylli TaxID=489916 RepID=A0ABU4AV11_9NOCA|nr:GAF and ANTAR domain-containing protein [Rhodococcus cercidiphylli]MDV6230075.1 GAF and ANTAR domain-containing protein [Rhodococcus cercidiphylli]
MIDRSVEDGNCRLRSSRDTTVPVFGRAADCTHALRRVRDKILSGKDVDAVLQAVCAEVAAVLPGSNLVGITIVDDAGRPRTVASTDATVNVVDSDQYRTGEGPCLEAARSRSVVRASVDEAESRWPRFSAAVADLGIDGYLAAPLALDGGRFGSLNVYGVGADNFTTINKDFVELLATSIETVVALLQRLRSAEEEVTGLRTAMKTRGEIDQAKGMVMALRGISGDAAFALLSEQSQNRNIKVSDIAASMIDSIAQQSGTGLTQRRGDRPEPTHSRD